MALRRVLPYNGRTTLIDPEIRDLKVEWVTLAGAMNGMHHLHVAQTHGDNSVTELWLTEKQAHVVGQTALAEREAKLADTRQSLLEPQERCGHPKACVKVLATIDVPSVGPGDELVGKLEHQTCIVCAQRDVWIADTLREVEVFLDKKGVSLGRALVHEIPSSQIAAQAEERDRRLVAKARLNTLLEIKDKIPANPTYFWMHKIADAEREVRESAHRAAVQEKP